MANKLKGFLKDSVLYGLGEVFGRLSGLILVPILSRIFLPSDYGIIDLLNLSFAFVYTAITLNIYTGLQKYYYINSGEEKKRLVTSTFLFLLFCSSFVAAVAAIFAKQISLIAFNKLDYYPVIRLLAILLPIETVYAGLILILRLNRRTITFCLYSIGQVIILPLMTYIGVVNLHMGLEGVFFAKLGTSLILIVPLFIQQIKEFSKGLQLRKAVDLVIFSLPGLPAVIILDIMNILPRYFLAYFSTLTAVGIFGMADRIAKLVEMCKTSFNRAWNPFAFSNAGKQDEKYLYEKVFKFFTISLIMFIIILTFFAKEILVLLTPPEYHEAALLVGGLCFYYAIRALTLVYSTGLYSTNRVAHTSYLETVQLCVFVSSAIVLVPNYGSAGLVMALDISAIVYFVCYAFVTKKYFSFKFSSSRLLPMVILAICGYLLCTFYVTDTFLYPGILVSKISFVSLYALIGYFIILDKEEKTSLQKKLKSLRSARILPNPFDL